MDATAIRAVLSRTPALNVARLKSLIASADGTLERALEPRSIREADLPPKTHAYLSSPDLALLACDLEWIEASGARPILCTDPEYPPQLVGIAHAPPVLFVLGNSAALLSRQVAIVGSRNPTPVGRSTAHDFAAELARAGLTITSGLAVGIDAAGHEGALLGGPSTIAVCATGLDEVYPRQHEQLAARIRHAGALLSEFPPQTAPAKANFPRRNRLISGLSAATLVIEAALRSGSLQTARFAIQQGRKLFAVPGSIHEPLKQGCHHLIREGARLVQQPADVLSDLKISLISEALARASAQPARARSLDNEYEMLLDALGFESATIDSLAGRTGQSCESVASMLLILELEGRVAPHPGGRYGRIP